jgi:hypothetical protein
VKVSSRRSGTKLNIAVIRRSVVATRGLESAFLMWVSAVRLAVRPILSTACEKWSKTKRLLLGRNLAFSKSKSGSSLTESTEEKERWLTLINGKIRCFEMSSAEKWCPRKHVSHLHLNPSPSSSKARSYFP